MQAYTKVYSNYILTTGKFGYLFSSDQIPLGLAICQLTLQVRTYIVHSKILQRHMYIRNTAMHVSSLSHLIIIIIMEVEAVVRIYVYAGR